MEDIKILDGKRVLIVDDEADVLEAIQDLLTNCHISTAPDYEGGVNLLNENKFDIAVLDIMGVHGYELLEITSKKGIPTLMLTANALTPEHFLKSIEQGAAAYIPKEKMAEIGTYLSDLLKAKEGIEKPGRWFRRLESFFSQWFADYHELKAEVEKRLGYKIDSY